MNHMWVPFLFLPIVVLLGHMIVIVLGFRKSISIRLSVIVELASIAFFSSVYLDLLPNLTIAEGLKATIFILLVNFIIMIITIKRFR